MLLDGVVEHPLDILLRLGHRALTARLLLVVHLAQVIVAARRVRAVVVRDVLQGGADRGQAMRARATLRSGGTRGGARRTGQCKKCHF